MSADMEHEDMDSDVLSRGIESDDGYESTNDPSAPLSSKKKKGKHKGELPGVNGGRWTAEEHENFLIGLNMYGREWKKVASKIKTRTSAQIRSHAQKYFAKLQKEQTDSKKPHPHLAGYLSDGSSRAFSDSVAAGDRGTKRPPSQIRRDEHSSILDMEGGSPVKKIIKTEKKLKMPLRVDCTFGDSDADVVFNSEKTGIDVPSQEEMLQTLSPQARHRVASLAADEICALQVLAWHATHAARHARLDKAPITSHDRKNPMSLSTITEQNMRPSAVY